MPKKLTPQNRNALITASATIIAAIIGTVILDFFILILGGIGTMDDYHGTYHKNIFVLKSPIYRHHVDLAVTDKPEGLTAEITEKGNFFWQRFDMAISIDGWLAEGQHTIKITGEGEDGLVRSRSCKIDMHHAVSIAVPDNQIGEKEMISGTLNEPPEEDYALCIVVHADNRYYPQSIPKIEESGEWSSAIDLTDEGFSCLSEAKVLAVLADSTAAGVYQEYLNQQGRTGWKTLPSGSHISGCIDVTLKPDISIANIPDDGTVDMQREVTGTAKHIGDNSVYVVIYSCTDKMYYPQKIYDISPNGEWSQTLYFGNESSGGNQYRLMLVTADADTRIAYDQYIEASETHKTWPGMKELPDGTAVMREIDIVRTTPDIYITSPQDKFQITMRQAVKGIARGMGSDSTLFTVIYSHNARIYYPKRVYDILPSGEWAQTLYFGEEQDTGRKFKLLLIIAKGDTAEYLENYISECEVNQSWTGMLELPDDVLIMDTVEVTREASLARGSITYPKDTALVDMQETITGTVNSMREDTHIYLVVYSPQQNRYYPQGNPELKDDGEWSCAVYFGNAQNSGHAFELRLVAVSASTAKAYQNYLDTCESSQSWPGMAALPDGSQTLHNIQLTRK